MNATCEEIIRESPDFEQYFQEGYCKASVDCQESTEVITDVDCSSPCGREKSDEDGDNDYMLGDVFDFSEEGMNLKQLSFGFNDIQLNSCCFLYVCVAFEVCIKKQNILNIFHFSHIVSLVLIFLKTTNACVAG